MWGVCGGRWREKRKAKMVQSRVAFNPREPAIANALELAVLRDKRRPLQAAILCTLEWVWEPASGSRDPECRGF